MTPKLTLIDRIVCGATGAVFGGLIGFALSWLLGVYSNTFWSAREPLEIKHWIIASATFFGVVGVLFGPIVGTVIGTVIATIYRLESGGNPEIPTWLLALLLIAIVGGVLWWLSK